MTAAEAVLQVRERYEGIKLIVSENYHQGWYLRRDEYMVRKADVIVAYWDLVPKGGTFYTVSKALECGKPVINIHERLR